MTPPPLIQPDDATTRLLMACVRAQIGDAPRENVTRALAGAVDWSALLTLAGRHRVIPLLYEALAEVDGVPPVTGQRLQHGARLIARQSLFLTGELLAVLDALRAEAIVALPYKGPALAEVAYGGIARRAFHDLDLLVPRDAIWRATAVLEARGYQREVTVGPAWETALLAAECEWRLHDPERGVTIELNWGAIPAHLQARLAPGQFWPRAQTISIGGREVPGLSNEDLLLLLCWHGAKHLWQELGWIVDVAALLRSKGDLQWDVAASLAAAAGSERVWHWGLCLAATLLDAPLPPAIRAAIAADVGAQALTTAVRQTLFAGGATRGQEEPLFHPFYWRMLEHWPARLRYLRDIVFVPNRKDWTWVSLPRSLGFLYYGLRPVRLAGRYLGYGR